MKKTIIIIAVAAFAAVANAAGTQSSILAGQRKLIAEIRELKNELARYHLLDAPVRDALLEKLEKAKKAADDEGELSALRQITNFDSAHDCERIWLWIDEGRYPDLEGMKLALRRCILKYRLIGYKPREKPIDYKTQKGDAERRAKLLKSK